MVQHNDYHFIIKQLVEELKRQFQCSGENTEKYITFSVPIKKEEDDDNGKKEEDDNGKKEEEDDNNSKKKETIMYKLKFIDSSRFMQSKLSDVIDNWSGINSKECKSCMKRKKLNQNAILLGLKTMDWITDAKNVKKMHETNKWSK